MQECTLNSRDGETRKSSRMKTGWSSFKINLTSSLGTLLIVILLLFTGLDSHAQLSCDHDPENFATSDPSCPGSEDFNIAKIDRSVTHEIFYVKVSGDACCGNFLINPKSGTDCYFDTSIAGPSGPDVVITEVGTVPDTCNFGDLTQCPDYGADYDKELIIRCSDGSIGHRITFLGSFEDGTDSYWYYEVENNVDGCLNDISHLAFGVIDDVCCLDYTGETSAVCEGEDSEFVVTPTGADDYLFFIDVDEDDMYDGAVDTFLAEGMDNTYSGVHSNNEIISVLVTDGTECEDYLEITAEVYSLPAVTANDASVCIGSTVQLTASPSGGTWSGAHVSSSGLFDATGLTADDYTVTYTYSDGNGCENSDNATVTVDALPEFTYVTPPLDCFAEAGSIGITSDTEGLEFRIDDGPWFTYTGTIDVAPGQHTIMARDVVTLCESAIEDFTISPLLDSPVTPTLDAIQPTCEVLTGTIIVTSRTEGLRFAVLLTADLNGEIPNEDYISYPTGGFSGLAPGEYAVFAISADGCQSGMATITLFEPDCPEFEGCTLGYWKNHTDRWCDEYQTCTGYDEVFGTETNPVPAELSGLTLLEVLNLGGGGIFNLGRQSVAALLNACSNEIDYELATTDDVIAYVNENFENAGDAGTYLDMLNNAGCTMGGSRATSADQCTDEADGGNRNNGRGNDHANNGGNNRNSQARLEISTFPVPFKETVNVQYDFDYTSDVEIEVFNMRGNHLRTYTDKNVTKGSVTRLQIDFAMKANQMYILKVKTDRETFVKQIVSSKK